MEIKEAVKMIVNAIEDKKGEEVRVIDISKVSVIGDFFIIASGNNRSQIQAIADDISEKLGRAGLEQKNIEGYQNANWVLIDFGDIVVHLFDQENRSFYDLDRIWRDGDTVDVATL